MSNIGLPWVITSPWGQIINTHYLPCLFVFWGVGGVYTLYVSSFLLLDREWTNLNRPTFFQGANIKCGIQQRMDCKTLSLRFTKNAVPASRHTNYASKQSWKEWSNKASEQAARLLSLGEWGEFHPSTIPEAIQHKASYLRPYKWLNTARC